MGLGLLRVRMQVGAKALDPGPASFGISNEKVAEGTGWLCVSQAEIKRSQDSPEWSSLLPASFVVSVGAPLALPSPPGRGGGLSCC